MTSSEGGWGYPPMATLQGAVPGWPDGRTLSSAVTPEAARAVLRAERETFVLDPRGPRRLWWRDGAFVVALLLVAASVWAGVQFFRTGDPPAWVLCIGPAAVFLNLGSDYLTVRVTRAVPAAGVVAGEGTARWRRRRALRQQPSVVPPVADWPPGSEAYALLSGAASVQSVAPTWLGARVGLPPEISALWIAALKREGWLTGGGHVLGWSRLPERHIEVTDAGRGRLATEAERLLVASA
jgi:hypothetical protein